MEPILYDRISERSKLPPERNEYDFSSASEFWLHLSAYNDGGEVSCLPVPGPLSPAKARAAGSRAFFGNHQYLVSTILNNGEGLSWSHAVGGVHLGWAGYGMGQFQAGSKAGNQGRQQA